MTDLECMQTETDLICMNKMISDYFLHPNLSFSYKINLASSSTFFIVSLPTLSYKWELVYIFLF